MIVNCAAYARGCRVADIDLAAVSDYVALDDHFVWIGLLEPTEEELVEIATELGLHELAVEDAHRAHQRPKIEEYGSCLFVALRTASCDPEASTIRTGETHLFVGARYLVSVRHGETPGYADVRARCECSPHLLKNGSGFVLYALMDAIVDRYFPVVDGLEEQLEALEQEIFGEQTRQDVAARIYDMKGELITIKRAVSPLIDVCNRLVRYDQGLIADEVRPYFRDVYDHVVRINESVDNVRELVTSALEANLSLVSIRQNEVMKTLAGWAAIFGVMTLMAGIWGMNFEGMPELHSRYGYPAALVSMGVVAVGLYAWLRRAGWL